MGYAVISDLEACGLPAGALTGVTFDDQQRALDDASALADNFLGDTVTLPLGKPYDRTLVRMVCVLAAWDLICLRGFNPSNVGDDVIKYRYEAAMDWLKRVANKQIRIVANQSVPESIQPDVSTNDSRGYGDIAGDGTVNFPGVLV